MKREILVCDRCKASAETDEEKKELGLGKLVLAFDVTYHSRDNGAGSVYAPHCMWQQEWCRKCRTEVGCLEAEVRQANRVDKPVTSLEDMVREIMREEIANTTGAQ